jgi:Helix-turn-helix domain
LKSRPSTIEPPLRVQTAEAARQLGVNMRTVQLMAGRGELPGAAKIGNAWTFDVVKLRAFIAAKEAECAAGLNKPIPKSPGCEPPRNAAAIDKAYEQMMLRARGGKPAKGSWSAKRRAAQGRPPTR